jgi:NAD(P)-dependent dehydrogenase (short-subunit alcohol dehydrogenase family)
MGTFTPSFDGDVAFVTGASGGMGRAIAVAFARAGAKVVMCDVNDDGGEQTAVLAADAGGEAIYVRADVSDGDQVAAAVAVAVDRFGGLDCAVNAAAIETETALLHEATDESFDRMQAVNLRGVFLSLKYELRAILAHGRGGAVVNIASTNAFRPQPHQAAYTASKHGVLGLTRAAAIDYAPLGIRVNAICPGGIDTPMLQNAMARRGREPQDVINRLSLMGRFGTAEEIANAALWLCSDSSSYTVGHPLAVDAGYLAR